MTEVQFWQTKKQEQKTKFHTINIWIKLSSWYLFLFRLLQFFSVPYSQMSVFKYESLCQYIAWGYGGMQVQSMLERNITGKRSKPSWCVNVLIALKYWQENCTRQSDGKTGLFPVDECCHLASLWRWRWYWWSEDYSDAAFWALFMYLIYVNFNYVSRL